MDRYIYCAVDEKQKEILKAIALKEKRSIPEQAGIFVQAGIDAYMEAKK